MHVSTSELVPDAAVHRPVDGAADDDGAAVWLKRGAVRAAMGSGRGDGGPFAAARRGARRRDGPDPDGARRAHEHGEIRGEEEEGAADAAVRSSEQGVGETIVRRASRHLRRVREETHNQIY